MYLDIATRKMLGNVKKKKNRIYNKVYAVFLFYICTPK